MMIDTTIDALLVVHSESFQKSIAFEVDWTQLLIWAGKRYNWRLRFETPTAARRAQWILLNCALGRRREWVLRLIGCSIVGAQLHICDCYLMRGERERGRGRWFKLVQVDQGFSSQIRPFFAQPSYPRHLSHATNWMNWPHWLPFCAHRFVTSFVHIRGHRKELDPGRCNWHLSTIVHFHHLLDFFLLFFCSSAFLSLSPLSLPRTHTYKSSSTLANKFLALVYCPAKKFNWSFYAW